MPTLPVAPSRVSFSARTLIAGLCLLLIGALPALAQRDVTLRIGAGGNVLTRPDNVDAYMGSGTNLGVDVSIGLLPKTLPGLDFVLESTFDRFTTNESDLLLFYGSDINQATEEVDGGSLALLSGMASLRYTVVDAEVSSKPYFMAGVGVHHSIFQPSTFRDDEGQVIVAQTDDGRSVVASGPERIETHLGFTAGFGLDFSINDTYGVFVEGRYIVVRNGDYGDAPTHLFGFAEITTTRYYPIRFGATIRLASFGSQPSADASASEEE
jgi:opacity protein-like surface antigen